jgi:hypothetical protein
MGWIVSLVALLAVLFLLAYRMPGQRILIIVAITLAVVVMIVGIERAGWWPEGLRTQ